VRLLPWAFSAAVVIAAPARAQVALQTELSAPKVEVGESVQLELSAMSRSDADRPTAPRLSAPAGVEVRGPSVSSQTRVSIINGRMDKTTGITMTWTLTPSRTGKFRIGPPSVEVNGRRQAGEAVELEVVAAGSLPRTRPRPGQPGFDPFNFFDPFGSSPFPGGVKDPTSDDFADDLPPAPKELALDQPLDPQAFVRVLVKPEHPVVGEQVTLDIYSYGKRGPLRPQNVSEPSRPDFLAFAVEDADNDPIPLQIADDVWVAQRLRQYALFPLKAGRLSIGAVEAQFAVDRLRSRRPLERRSTPLEIVVEEPPAAGRPPGYRLGDVGRYELTANVEPRSVPAGDAVSVVARLEGSGNVPAKLFVPQQNGVEWLEPTIAAEVEPSGSIVRGYRTFTYVIKLTEPGEIKLGELSLPYWDPEARAYRVARAELGSIAVTPGEKRKDKPAAPESPLATLGKPRQTLAGDATRASPLGDRPLFWFLLFGAPLSVVVGDGGLRLARWLGRRRAAQQNDPRELAQQALGQARRLAGKDDAAALAQVERALFLALEAGPGLKARALLKSELERELEQSGMVAEQAQSVVELLTQCENARFTGKLADGGDLVGRAERLIPALLRHKRPR
jgi:hypothetical protein